MAKKTIDPFEAAKQKALGSEPKSKKPETPKVPMGEALQIVAACAALEENIKGVKDAAMVTLKEEALDVFYAEGAELGARPANFKAQNGQGEAGIEMQIRKNTSVLGESEIALLTNAGIKVEAVEVSPESYAFNPEILKDPLLRAKLVKALSGVDFGGKDAIVYTPAQKKVVASEEMIQTLLKGAKSTRKTAKSKAEGKTLLGLLTGLTVKPKWNGTRAEAYTVLSPALAEQGRKADEEKAAKAKK